MTDTGSKIIVALDYADTDQAMAFVNKVSPDLCRLKVGKELFTCSGPALVENLVVAGYDVFLDLKFHDIPNTVAKACAVAADLGVWMMNVHALGGRRMMTAAREAIASHDHSPLLIAVTILTSMEKQDLAEVGLTGDPQQNVLRLAALTKDSGLDGVVCSPMEVAALRQATGDGFKLVTPGVRPQGADKSDQRRTMTPAEAVSQGSDYLVIGRPITQADNPVQALENIAEEIR